MRSSELAALAGVTVRTLRHYHQIGVLQEPERSANGYRVYDVRHLVRVVRITRLTGLGVPLAELPAVLDEPSTAGELLDELDREAAAEIERLTARRALIAELRRDGAAPDLPPRLASYPAALEAAGVDGELARFERDHLTLLAHLSGDSGTAALATVYAKLVEILPATAELNERFMALGPDSTDEAVERLVDDIVALYTPALSELANVADLDLPPARFTLLTQYTDLVLNDSQRDVVRLMGERLGDMSEDRSGVEKPSARPGRQRPETHISDDIPRATHGEVGSRQR